MGAFGKLKGYVQILIVAGVSAALLGAVWYWFLSPLQLDIVAKTARLREVEAIVKKSKERQAALAQFKKDTEQLQADLAEIKKVLPEDKETAQLLDQVQASASAAGLRIQVATSRSIVDHEVYTEWPLEMEVLGTYHNLGSYFERIRQLPRIVNINKLRIESRAAEGGNSLTASVGATYEVTTFVYREEVPAAAPKAPAAKAGAR